MGSISCTVVSVLIKYNFLSLLYFQRWSRFLGRFLHHRNQPARWVLYLWICCLAFLVLKFLLLLILWSAARGGSVTDVHNVAGLIHGPAAGADASCISRVFLLLFSL